MKGIIWLASYPKSGNTWFRIFLTNLLQDANRPASINELQEIPIASSRILFDENIGIESSDLTSDEISRFRPELYTYLSENATEQIYMKIHDAYISVEKKKFLIPKESTACAVYFIRNPLDVAVSFAYHNAATYDLTISQMSENNLCFCGKHDRLYKQLQQRLLSWSNHVLSWVDAAPFPVCVLRYEDMKSNTFETFEKAVRFVGLSHTNYQIQKAIDFSSFEELQEQEEKSGFKERSTAAQKFFRKGKVGSWREELTKEQVERIINDHREVMQRFGYL
ncbi:MAG: sulfotransferase domain-containing protein [Candidatus Riflebacteria bacterium]|nr:sulfotransferase domain-containing protein [Candidatus Riflebacteria bacterium]